LRNSRRGGAAAGGERPHRANARTRNLDAFIGGLIHHRRVKSSFGERDRAAGAIERPGMPANAALSAPATSPGPRQQCAPCRTPKAAERCAEALTRGAPFYNLLVASK
jgi:hypothetical protein